MFLHFSLFFVIFLYVSLFFSISSVFLLYFSSFFFIFLYFRHGLLKRVLTRLGGGVWESVWAPKWGPFLSDSPLLRRDSGTQTAALAEVSPKARLKPYFSRACPQDDVSSTRQTPSN